MQYHSQYRSATFLHGSIPHLPESGAGNPIPGKAGGRGNPEWRSRRLVAHGIFMTQKTPIRTRHGGSYAR